MRRFVRKFETGRKNYVQSVKQTNNNKKKKHKPINYNTNYRKEMKFIPVNVDYCLT